MSMGTLARQATRHRAVQPLVSCLRENAFAAWGSSARGFADDANLKKTALYDLHVEQGGMYHSCELNLG